MSLKHPFSPAGICEHCRFSSPINKNHWMSENYPLFCHRFPPTPPSNSQQVWNNETPVDLDDFCAEFEVDGPTKQAHADDYHNSLTQEDFR